MSSGVMRPGQMHMSMCRDQLPVFEVRLQNDVICKVILNLLYFIVFMEIIRLSGLETMSTLPVLPGQRGEQFQKELVDGSKLQITINKKFVEPSYVVSEDDEITFSLRFAKC